MSLHPRASILIIQFAFAPFDIDGLAAAEGPGEARLDEANGIAVAIDLHVVGVTRVGRAAAMAVDIEAPLILPALPRLRYASINLEHAAVFHVRHRERRLEMSAEAQLPVML